SSIGAALRAAGPRLKHLHACENDRGAPGSGHVPWTEVAEALRDISYDGGVVIESFTSQVKSIARAAAIWRPLAATQDALAVNADEARQLLDQANKAGVIHAVTFNYRGNPLIQQARLAIARGDIGTPRFLVGQYLQDWLLKDTDYSWRLEPDKGGASSALGDIGSHWCDLAQHVSGLRITHVLGDITPTIPKRKKPVGSRE